MSIFAPPPPPPTGLGRYRLLSPTAGAHVPPIVLGGGNIGTAWHSLGFGGADRAASFALLDAYFAAGGNFIDTANHYQDGESEVFIGEWAEARGIRDQLFIATKYSSPYAIQRDSIQQKINFAGNNAKSLHVSVTDSLKKLRTTYIDLLYLHWWDWDTSVEEVMRALHTLVLQGKVLYLGVSDTPAWVVSKANQYARDHALTPFCVYQGEWNVMRRSFQREIIPMAKSEGMALAPWNVLAGGRIRTDAEEARRRESGEKGRTFAGQQWERNDEERRMCAVLEAVAAQIGAKNITAVAIAYVMHKAPFVFPIIGGRKVEHLHANLEALELSLKEEHIKAIEDVCPLDPGFPGWMIGDGSTPPALLTAAGYTYRPLLRPLQTPVDSSDKQ